MEPQLVLYTHPYGPTFNYHNLLFRRVTINLYIIRFENKDIQTWVMVGSGLHNLNPSIIGTLRGVGGRGGRGLYFLK